MRKYLCYVFFSMLTVIPALAMNVCTKQSVVTIVLDPSLPVNNYDSNAATNTWKANASYGTIVGISTCASSSADNTNMQSPGGENTGNFCWCKMTHPIESLWTKSDNFSHSDNCSSVCPDLCARAFYNNSNSVRSNIFGSVQQ